MDGSNYRGWHGSQPGRLFWSKRIAVKNSIILMFVIFIMTIATIIALDKFGLAIGGPAALTVMTTAGQG